MILRTLILLVVSFVVSASAELPVYPKATPSDRGEHLKKTPWIETIEREVAPLKNDLGDQLPMIMWHGVGFQSLSKRQIDILRKRGLNQHLQLDVSMIPAAKALQSEGMPVILMEGRTDNWPYSLAKDPDEWSHRLSPTYQPSWFGKDDAFEWFGACPNQTAGWRILEKQTRERMRKFRDAGVTINGVWTDYEGDPYPWGHLYDQIKNCRRCRKQLPKDVYRDENAWRAFAWKKYVHLYDQHFAKPIREVFPNCLVTNWHVVASTKSNPVRYFVNDRQLPELTFKYFNGTNPIGYASDSTWHAHLVSQVSEESVDHVDSFFTEEILQQIRTDAANRKERNDDVVAIPWVARFCKIESSSRRTPLMTRRAYQAALGRVWQHDIATLQIFNPMHNGLEEYALMEVQDAVAALDQWLGLQKKK